VEKLTVSSLPMLALTLMAALPALLSAQGNPVRLSIPLAEVHEPTCLYHNPSNGGVLFTEPDGKTVRFLYSRTLGATLIEHPTQPFTKVLHLGREKCNWVFNEQDGANWNFPIGKKGSLETPILLRKGFKGGAISLVDVFYPPSDNAGDEAAMYKLDIPADGILANPTTTAGKNAPAGRLKHKRKHDYEKEMPDIECAAGCHHGNGCVRTGCW